MMGREDFITLEQVLRVFPDGPIENWDRRILERFGLDPDRYDLEKQYSCLGWLIVRKPTR